jgi:hypothetical protein
MLAPHLLQSALVHINTMLLQRILSEPAWSTRLSDADRRALTPPFWTYVSPYGKFTLDMDTQLDLDPRSRTWNRYLSPAGRSSASGSPERNMTWLAACRASAIAANGSPATVSRRSSTDRRKTSVR